MESDARGVADVMNGSDRVAHHYDMSIDEVADGRATVSVTVTEEMANGLGVCHGGLVFTLADTAMAYGSNSGNRASLSTSASIEWVRPAHVGDRIRATSTRVAVRGRNEIHDVVVSAADGSTVALVRGQTLSTGETTVARVTAAHRPPPETEG